MLKSKIQKPIWAETLLKALSGLPLKFEEIKAKKLQIIKKKATKKQQIKKKLQIFDF